MVYLKLSQQYESESGDSRSDSFIVCHPSVSGLAHHKFSHNPPKTFDINLSSNVNFSVPLYHTFPILVPEFFVFIIFFCFIFLKRKSESSFATKPKRKTISSKLLKSVFSRQKGGLFPIGLSCPHSLGGDYLAGDLLQKSIRMFQVLEYQLCLLSFTFIIQKSCFCICLSVYITGCV